MEAPWCARNWTFRPLPTDDRDRRLLDEPRVAVLAALRAGHPLGVRFTLSLATGPRVSVDLAVADATSARWASRVLTAAYHPHQWVEHPIARSPERPHQCWEASRVRPWPVPLRTPADGPNFLDAVALAFVAAPPGARCLLTFRSVPTLFSSYRPDSSLEAVPRARAGPFRPPLGPSTRPLLPPIEQTAFWRARVVVFEEEPAGSGDGGARAARTVESASRTLLGNGLRLHRRPAWSLRGEREFEVSESEVGLVLPGTSSPWAHVSNVERPGDARILPLGRDASGRVIGPPIEPGQGRHLAVLGESGMGKSSLLVAIVRRLASEEGLVLFDPLGETAAAARRSLPSRALDRLLWVTPSAGVGLNALAGVRASAERDPPGAERQLNDLVHALRRVRSGRFSDASYWGPRLEEMLTRALRAAAALPNGTIADAHRLLASGGRGFRTLPPSAVGPANELAERIRARPEDADGAQRLLHEVTRSSVLLRMLCEPNGSIAAGDLVVPGRVTLVSGEAALVGETVARYLLSTYLALVWSELLGRPDGRKTFVVLDEAQWFGHESLAEMLRLGRRRNVHVVLATQALSSLPETVTAAAWTNVADFVAFRGSIEEARELSKLGRGVDVGSILSLPRGAAAVWLGKGGSILWARTLRVPSCDATAPAQPPSGSPTRSPAGAPPRNLELRCDARRADSPVSVDGILEVIRARARAEAPAGLFGVSPGELRTHFDPDGAAVRGAGSILRRQGALVRIERDASGSRWWVDPTRLETTEVSPAPVGPLSAEDEGKS